MRNNHDDERENAPVNGTLTAAERARLLELCFERKEAEEFLIAYSLAALLKLGPKLTGVP